MVFVNFMKDHWGWVSGVVGTIGAGVLWLYKLFRKKKKSSTAEDTQSEVNDVNNELHDLKMKTHILFVDDDGRYRVVNILKQSGWAHTSRVADIANLDDNLVQSTHLFFIDINGVGIKLKFTDEGLGLAVAIKKKYPQKKVVIYSAQSQGERFHKALRQADDLLSKNADPYEFQEVTERLSKEFWDNK